ncbi:hypothetical protein RND81_10G230700 [Saponaria officinalis]|uniref:Uncharacterized protein n=1 Tax=Saponaria officinalis TaxID=3572 RepID=A0AAW1I5K7_SAPOF
MTNFADNSVSHEKSSNTYATFDDPLFLSTSDEPMLQLVGYHFDGTNFMQWKRDVFLALVAKNKEGFVNGSAKCPDTLVYVRNSKDLWTEILDRYGQSNSVEIYQLKKDLGDITQQNDSLVEYFSKLKRTWENIDSIYPLPLCSCGAIELCTCKLLKRIVDRESQSRLLQFLMGLNNMYDSVRSNVLTMEPLPPLNKAFALLQKVERQKLISEAVDVLAEANAFNCSQTSDFQTVGKKPRTDADSSVKTCNYCHHLGHTKDECFKLRECSYCGRKGHARDTCYRLRNNSNKKTFRGRGRGRYSSRNNFGYTKTASHTEILTEPADGNEYTPIDDTLSSPLQPSSSATIDNKLVSGIVDTIMEKVFLALSEKSTSHCTTSFAGIIPNFTAFSTSHRSVSKGWIVDSGTSDHMTSDIGLLTDIQTLPSPTFVGLPDGSVKLVTKISTMVLSSKIHLLGVLLVPDFKQNLLSVSKLASHYHLTVVFTPTECLFQVPSSDFCVVKAERIGDLYWIKSCSAPNNETQFATKLKVMRSDNGSEFFQKNCSTFLAERGVIHQRSIAGLPVSFWGECVLTATYLINKMPTKLLGWISPFELLMGEVPSYDNLRVFGCLCFASMPITHRDKFGQKGRKCVFVGYPFGQKGYNVYDVDRKKIFVCCGVVFRESCFPFKEAKQSQVIGTNKSMPTALELVNTSIPGYKPDYTTSQQFSDSIPTNDMLISSPQNSSSGGSTTAASD